MFDVIQYIQNMLSNFTVYGLMIVLGILTAGAWGCFNAKRYNLIPEDIIILETYIMASALIFAKILYIIVNLNAIHWEELKNAQVIDLFLRGGFVYYGGFLGALLVLPLVKKIHKIPVIKYMELMIPALPFAQGLGRIGCHFAGCCYGVPYDGLFCVTYHHTNPAINGMSLFPVQLLESVCCFILAAILVVYVLKHKELTPNSIYIYIFGYGIIRFVTEFLRYDNLERGIYFGLSTSQWISIGLVLATASIRIIKEHQKNCLRL